MPKNSESINSFRPCNIIEAKSNLTKIENDIIDIVFSIINNESEDEKQNLLYEINIADYKNMYNMVNNSHVYAMLRNGCKTIMNKHFVLWDEFNGEHDFQWVSAVHYKQNEGRIAVELGATMKKMLIEMRSDTYYPLKASLCLTSQYSQRLYYMLKRYVDTGIRYENPDRLMKSMMVPESYSYQKFKERVILQAQEEINEKTDIGFTFKEDTVKSRGKTGVRVTKIIFYIKKKDITLYTDKEKKFSDKYNVTEQQARCILLAAENNNISEEEMTARISYITARKNIRNFVGYCIFAMNNDNWVSCVSGKSTFDFNEKRNYTKRYYELLEKKLLNCISDDELKELMELS